MACRRTATCRARFARGEQACVRCAEGKLDIGDVEDLDDEETDDEEECAYTTQPDGKFGDLAGGIEVGGETVRGLRVIVNKPYLGDVEYVIVALDARKGLPANVRDCVDYFAEDGETLYDILAPFVGYDIKSYDIKSK